MNKLFFSTFAFLLIVSSWYIFDIGRYLLPDLLFSQGIKYESGEVHKQIAKALKEENIPFRINNEGFIEYRKKDDEKVKKIAAQIHIASAPVPKVEQSPPNTSFSNPETHKLFVELLEKEGIPYKIDRLGDKRKYVIWNLNDDEKVLELVAQVTQKTSCNNSPPSIAFPAKKHTEYFISLLKKEDIPYKVVEKTRQQGIEIYIEYGWKDYIRVKKLIRRTIAEAPINDKT
ncbi:MAG: hypothetical protein GY705_15760 [Bacteroidetes bacterium]|nr:hypothetical protein [Bacteroidota bacterium]